MNLSRWRLPQVRNDKLICLYFIINLSNYGNTAFHLEVIICKSGLLCVASFIYQKHFSMSYSYIYTTSMHAAILCFLGYTSQTESFDTSRVKHSDILLFHSLSLFAIIPAAAHTPKNEDKNVKTILRLGLYID